MSEKPPLITGMEWDENDYQDTLTRFHERVIALAESKFPRIDNMSGGGVVDVPNNRRRYYLTVYYGGINYPPARVELPIGIITEPDGVDKVMAALSEAIERLYD